MNKLLSAILILTMALATITAAAPATETKEEITMEENKLGGWTETALEKIPEDVVKALEQALEHLTGASYEPVSLLAEQVVAGKNYAILCKVTPVVPNAVGKYCIAYLYVDPAGKAELVRVQELVPEADETLLGGWTIPEEDVTEAAQKVLESAQKKMVGAEYELQAVLATQLVAGTNYRLLCKVTPVVPDAEAHYCIVTVYEPLEGDAEITEVEDLEYSLQEKVEETTEAESK